MYKKKLIEVALPLDAINKASAREKSIRHGHPSTLHLWWARRPLAAARAVIFAQMVDDPSAHPDLFPTEKAQEKERKRLFKIIEDLVQWENTTNEEVLQRARDEIWESWRRTCAENADHPQAKELFDRHVLPAFHDPFAGGGALPLEAQRLGLESYASDLNPVAVLINKAMIEIPPKFAGQPPVNPKSRLENAVRADVWKGAEGLAEDVRYYGQWMRDEVEKRIGHLYPKVKITPDMVKERPDLKPYEGRELTVIAWIWARTVKSPNPAFAKIDVPLASTFVLSSKKGKEAHVQPVFAEDGYRFVVRTGKAQDDEIKKGTKLSRGSNFRCIMSDMPIPSDHIYTEARNGRMGSRLMAVVAEGDRERVYLSPNEALEDLAFQAEPEWRPTISLPDNPRWFSPPLYGLTTYGDLFTARQLVALSTLSGLVEEARNLVKTDAIKAGLMSDQKSLRNGGMAADAYAEAVAVYLAFAIDKSSVYWNTLCPWLNQPKNEIVGNAFGRQALPMVWDYAEANPLSDSGGNISKQFDYISKVLLQGAGNLRHAVAVQADAARQSISTSKVVSTDPPYYDNIGYADLSDFFYVWLRRSLRSIYPDLFATLSVPKAEELVATPYRHGSKDKAEEFFLDGMKEAMTRLSEQVHPAYPVTIYYAFKQSESDEQGTVSTGWDTFLEAVIQAGFTITGTWPVRTERSGRSTSIGTNALASSIVIVCRPRHSGMTTATRREFLSSLKDELGRSLVHLQRGGVAPVDLAQAAIGPGMAVFTRYDRVLDADGLTLSVRDALALINQTLDEILGEQEGDYDADTRWAITWLEQTGFADGEYGIAEVLSKAKVTSISSMVESGIVTSSRGKVRLLRPGELRLDWDPESGQGFTAWGAVHHLIRALEDGGEDGAAALMAKLGNRAEAARELAYRLYTICERKKRASEALSYNALVQSWSEISQLAGGKRKPAAIQEVFDEGEV